MQQNKTQPDRPTRSGYDAFLIIDDVRQPVSLANFNYSGDATLQFNGSYLRGSFVDGKLHGYGESADPKASYQGNWVHGLREGEGNELTVGGFSYQGNWSNDLKQGYGKLTYPNQSFYEGMWHLGKKHGFGLEQRPDRSSFKGNWQHDVRQGEGTTTFPDGTTLSGQWQNNKITGPALLTTPSEAQLQGEINQDSITTGTLSLTDGNVYSGNIYQPESKRYTANALTWLESTAHQNSAHAQYLLANAHLQGQVDGADNRLGITWLERAAEQKFVAAEFELAVIIQEQDWSRAQGLLESAARQNHAGAHALLAEYYHQGFHYPQDLSMAVFHYQAAIDGGSLSALNNYAWLLATTTSVYADAAEAARLIRPLVLYLNNWQLLDTFASSQARQGKFELAQSLQRQAIEDAQTANASDELQFELENRLSLYLREMPYLED